MGKAGFYLYGTRGKVGNVVARRGPTGGTVLAERKFSIKNPRTNKQMATRVICATVSQAAKFLSAIVDHSFEGKSIGARSKDYFRKLNMNGLRTLAHNDFEDEASRVDATCFMTTKGVSALIPNRYIVSNGSLAQPGLNVKITEGPGTQTLFVQRPNQTINALETTGVRHITVGQLLKALFGITQAGEQITFVGIQKTGAGYVYAFNGEPDVPGWKIPYTGMIARRLFVDLSYDLTTQIAVTDNQGALLNDINATIGNTLKAAFNNERTDKELLKYIAEESVGDYTTTFANNQLAIADIVYGISDMNETGDEDATGYLYALGVIRSRLQENNTWLYSRCILTVVPPSTDEIYNHGLDWNSAVQAWMSGGGDVATDDLFLQAGTPQNVIGEDFT